MNSASVAANGRRSANYPKGSSRLVPSEPAAAAVKPAASKGSQLEADFLALLRSLGLPEPEREAKCIPGRQFRIDFYYPRAGLAIELEGGVWGRKSGHNSGSGIERDCLKSRLLSLHGIRLYRVTRKSLDEDGAEIGRQVSEILAPWYADAPGGPAEVVTLGDAVRRAGFGQIDRHDLPAVDAGGARDED